MVHLAHREQGLLVRRGNPKSINGLRDLLGQGIRFVNRQPGSGTRVLLDCELGKLGIEPASIAGYDREEFTHMAVGVAVVSHLADAGLGVRAVAHALELDFVTVASEQYDLLFMRSFFESENGARLVAIMRSDAFKQAVAALGGYDPRDAGEVLYRQ
jgi:putative molybdopterin biosynthesis protein